MADFDDRYSMTGKFLVAAPILNEDEIFNRSVIYICSHTKRGAMGIIINKPMVQYTFSDLTMQLPLKNYEHLNEINLYTGGPLEQIRGTVLHSTDYMKDGTIEVGNGIAISSTTEIIADIAFDQGPDEKLVALGYSFWEPKQLEAEIYNNDWIVVNGTRDLLFRTKDEEKWQRALDELCINFDRFALQTGHA